MFGPVAHTALADPRPAGSVDASGGGVLTAPAAEVSGGSLTFEFFLTPRPPVGLKESRRAGTADPQSAGWTSILQVAEYLIPQPGSRPPQLVSARSILSRVTACSVDSVPADISFRVTDLRNQTVRILFPSVEVPATGFLDLPLQSAVLGAQEVFQVRSLDGHPVHVTVSYVKATRERFTVLP